jgi:ATP-dependent exoDNAse (exonuclease V) beta subunit
MLKATMDLRTTQKLLLETEQTYFESTRDDAERRECLKREVARLEAKETEGLKELEGVIRDFIDYPAGNYKPRTMWSTRVCCGQTTTKRH